MGSAALIAALLLPLAGATLIRLFGRSFTAAVLERADLAPGQRIEGPAIINQMDTTTLIPAGWHGNTVTSGALIVERSTAQEN